MNLHQVITEFEAELAALFSRFRSHPTVIAAAVAVQQKPPPLPPPDYNPTPAHGDPVPVQANPMPATATVEIAPPAAPAAPVAPAGVAEVQPATVPFNPGLYPDPVARMAAAQALGAELHAKWGNFLTKVVGPNGYEIDVRGNEIFPDTSSPMDYWHQIGPNTFAADVSEAGGRWFKGVGKFACQVTPGPDFVGKVWPTANYTTGTAGQPSTTVNHGDLQDPLVGNEHQHKMIVFGAAPGPNEVAGVPGEPIEIEVDQEDASLYLICFYVVPIA